MYAPFGAGALVGPRSTFADGDPFLGGIEKALSGFSSTLGFHPDFNLREMLPAGHNGEVSMSRVNLFWKILRLRNGVKHKKTA